MAQTTRLFHTLASQNLKPAEIATHMNTELTEDNEQGMFVTMFIGLLNLKLNLFEYCNAGHNPPALGNADGQFSFLDMESNAPIGLWPGLEYVGESIDFLKGRLLFLYTDGLNEAEDTEQHQFGDDRLLEILHHTHFTSAKQVVEVLAQEVDRHRNGAEPNDDLTMPAFVLLSVAVSFIVSASSFKLSFIPFGTSRFSFCSSGAKSLLQLPDDRHSRIAII